jgi:hypothetical protein
VVVAIGTFFPYARVVVTGSFGTESVTRSAWQLGSGRTVTFTSGPLIVILAAFVLFNELRFATGRSRRTDG